ncbi:M3 family oligoendopeptidase [Pseudoneobacillus sp. C159]
MTTTTYSAVWDLDVFFEGGSSSPEFQAHIEETRRKLSVFEEKVKAWDSTFLEENKNTLHELLEEFQLITKALRQEGAFVSCLQAQNMADRKAAELQSSVTGLSAAFQSSLTIFDEKLVSFSREDWTSILEDERIAELRFVLSERRERATQKLSKEEETLINALGVDGYHAWGQMYDLIVGTVQIPFKENDEVKYLSVGQAANKFSSSDRQIRQTVFENWEKAWGEKADILAKTLNHLAGFRLNVYKKRGWEDVLKEPLDINRMSRKTLDTMWEVISDYKQPLVEYLQKKASLLGIEKVSWYDQDAPIGNSETKLSYQEGAEFILEHFAQFGEEKTKFAKMAFEERWIEAEDRPGKRPGGFHTYFPETGKSRIFMTYSGTPSNISTLAHELGHGFHTYAMRDLHPLNRNYAMNVAETASTFAEMILADASVKNASTKEEKIALLDDKVQRSVALLMNIHARFLFETRFYEERKSGMVSAERLNELMVQAQKEAYGDGLDQYHPLFWASKLHFFNTGVPFYNFPYTFGYLFSLGIYAKALEEGKGYEEKYIALLKDTACMTVEELAKKHLNVDLTEREFWEQAVKLCVKDVEEFLELTK